jgi:hypothetical protein
MAVICSKWPWNITFFNPSKIYPNLDFWFENIWQPWCQLKYEFRDVKRSSSPTRKGLTSEQTIGKGENWKLSLLCLKSHFAEIYKIVFKTENFFKMWKGFFEASAKWLCFYWTSLCMYGMKTQKFLCKYFWGRMTHQKCT